MITITNLASFEKALHHFAAVTVPDAYLKKQKELAIRIHKKLVENSPIGASVIWKFCLGKKPENGSTDIQRVLSDAKIGDTIWIYSDDLYSEELDDGDSSSAPRGLVLGSLQELDLV